MSTSSVQSSPVNTDSHSEERHDTIYTSAHRSVSGEPLLVQIPATLVDIKVLLANSLAGGAPTTSPIQIHSSNDTALFLPVFDDTPQKSARQWITQMERIAALAHWTPSLTLASAANHLAGSARDRHSAYGWRYDSRHLQAAVWSGQREITGL
ncbi:hypothetical protein MTO96_016898 [Rhipicephalus appendiculatus]